LNCNKVPANQLGKMMYIRLHLQRKNSWKNCAQKMVSPGLLSD